MSYTDTVPSPAARVRAASGVIAIHAVIGAGVILGLGITGVVGDEDNNLVSYFTPEPVAPPPPPPEPVDQPEPQPFAAPVAPKPPVALNPPSPIEVEPLGPIFSGPVVLLPPPNRLEIPTPPATATPTPAPAFAPVGVSPRNGPAGWITNDDYPRSDLVREREGTASYRLVVGSDGKVDACEITRSTGHASLDTNTCRLIEQRARFDPARNDRGETTVGTYTGSVSWRIPE